MQSGFWRVRKLGLVLAAAVFLIAVPNTAAYATGPSNVVAKSAYLYDDTAGKTLWSRYPDTRRPIGSITKVMTALIVLRVGGLDKKVTVKQKYIDYVIRHGASTANLRVGDTLTVRQLLYAMMLPSGCDAAYALADVYGPGWSAFVTKMNNMAASLGMSHTHFSNFDGLPWPTSTSGYSTARDVIKLGHRAMGSTTFRSVVATKSYSLASGDGHHAYTWTNTNQLLGSYSGAIGIKTGHTDAAGYCLLFAAYRNNRRLIGVVLNSTATDPNVRFTDAAKILNWGFGVTATTVPLSPAPTETPRAA